MRITDLYRCGALTLSLAATSALYADEVVIPASQDATIFGSTPTGTNATSNNSSSGAGMYVGTDGTGGRKRGLIEFNVAASVPSGSVITSASLTLYLGMVAGSGGGFTGGDPGLRTINFYTVSKAWNGTVNGATGVTTLSGGMGTAPKTGDATWNYAMYTSSQWVNPGGDFSNTVSSSFTETATATQVTPYTWPSNSQMVLNVQGWLDGTTTNNGWLLQNTDETDAKTFREFYTREGANELGVPAYAPELTVDFTPAPEPAAGAFFLIAAPFLLRRRARLAR